MFKCQKCDKNTMAGEKCHKIVVETRPKTYINQYKDRKGRKHEKVTEGTEIVREINVCEECYSQISEKPTQISITGGRGYGKTWRLNKNGRKDLSI